MSKSMEASSLYEAVKIWNWDLITEFIKNGTDINASLITTGPQAGYTALHLACIEENYYNAKKLIYDYKANVNAVGDDGAQPLHITSLFGRTDCILHDLLNSGGNVDAEFGRDIYEKYAKDGVWSDDFGGKMTLLTFAILNNKSQLTICLLDYKANLGIKSTDNKTLLMYAVEKNYHDIITTIVLNLWNHLDIMHARDNNGMHAVHYLLLDEKFGDFRYDQEICFSDQKENILFMLLVPGGDIFATVNGDPDTIILNKAAYRSCDDLLPRLLNLDFSIGKSKALYYATLPVKDPNKLIRTYDNIPQDRIMEDLERKRRRTIEYILEDLIIRQTFGLFVPKEEKQLMNKLIATDTNIKNIVHNYEKNFIHGYLEDNTIHYGTKSITLYEFLKKGFNDIKLKQLVKDDNLVKAYNQFWAGRIENEKKTHGLFQLMDKKITEARRRRKVLEEIEKIPQLKEAIPLPYEIVLHIIEYIDTANLAMFVDSFYYNYNSLLRINYLSSTY